MQVELTLDHPKHVEMFESFSELARGFARVTTLAHPDSINAIDRQMKQGMVVKMTVAFAYAGPLGLLFQGALPDGSVVDLVTIDAPTSDSPFKFGQ